MPVERTYAGHRTRYALRVGATLVCALTFGGPTREQPVWKMLLPGPNGAEISTPPGVSPGRTPSNSGPG